MKFIQKKNKWEQKFTYLGLLAWWWRHKIQSKDVKPKRLQHQRSPAINYLHPVNTERRRKMKRMLLDVLLGEQTHHQRTKCQYLDLDCRWQTWSNICTRSMRAAAAAAEAVRGQLCRVKGRHRRVTTWPPSRTPFRTFPGSLAAGMLVHPAAVWRTVQTRGIVSSFGTEEWGTHLSQSPVQGI